VEKLQILNTLLEMTKEAERLASEGVETELIRSLIADIRRKAQREHEKLRANHRQSDCSIPTRYELCMIGIREEFDFGRAPLPNVVALIARFSRIHEEIDRTIKEIKASSRIM
jgi:hypothetical protein